MNEKASFEPNALEELFQCREFHRIFFFVFCDIRKPNFDDVTPLLKNECISHCKILVWSQSWTVPNKDISLRHSVLSFHFALSGYLLKKKIGELRIIQMVNRYYSNIAAIPPKLPWRPCKKERIVAHLISLLWEKKTSTSRKGKKESKNRIPNFHFR